MNAKKPKKAPNNNPKLNGIQVLVPYIIAGVARLNVKIRAIKTNPLDYSRNKEVRPSFSAYSQKNLRQHDWKKSTAWNNNCEKGPTSDNTNNTTIEPAWPDQQQTKMK